MTMDDWRVGDRVMGPIGPGTIVAMTSTGDLLVQSGIPMLRIYVQFDSPSWEFMYVDASPHGEIRGIPYYRHMKNNLYKIENVAPTIFCPECGEEDYALEDDYLCAPCRFLAWDGPLT